MLFNIIKILIIFGVLGIQQNALASKMVFKSGDCSFNKETFLNFTLQITDGKLDLEMTILRALVNGLKGHLSFEFRMAKSKSYQSVFQHDINYCNLVRGTHESIYRRWYLSMLKLSNFARSCPIQPGYYYLKGWNFNGNLVPSFLYLGDYRMGGSFYYGKHWKRDDKLLVECIIDAILLN